MISSLMRMQEELITDNADLQGGVILQGTFKAQQGKDCFVDMRVLEKRSSTHSLSSCALAQGKQYDNGSGKRKSKRSSGNY